LLKFAISNNAICSLCYTDTNTHSHPHSDSHSYIHDHSDYKLASKWPQQGAVVVTVTMCFNFFPEVKTKLIVLEL